MSVINSVDFFCPYVNLLIFFADSRGVFRSCHVSQLAKFRFPSFIEGIDTNKTKYRISIGHSTYIVHLKYVRFQKSLPASLALRNFSGTLFLITRFSDLCRYISRRYMRCLKCDRAILYPGTS